MEERSTHFPNQLLRCDSGRITSGEELLLSETVIFHRGSKGVDQIDLGISFVCEPLIER